MGSFYLRMKRLEYLTTHLQLLKSKAPHSCGSFQRNIRTSCISFSNITKNFIIHDLRASSQAAKNADFGKTVDLDYDFDQLKVDDDHFERPESRGNYNVNKFRKPKVKIEETGNQNKIPLDPETEYNSEDNPIQKERFKLSNHDSNTFRNCMVALKSKKTRKKKGQILLEGKRLIQEAISAGYKPLKIFFSRFSDLRVLNLPEDVAVTQVSYKTLNLWSDVVTSQGVIGVFNLPKIDKINIHSKNIPLTVICDNVRDPGNLGSIIRIVAAVGGEELILTHGCVDPWEPKVLRSGAGAHFHLKIKNEVSWSDIQDIIPDGIQVVLADNEGCNSNKASEDENNESKKSLFRCSSELPKSLPTHCYSSFNYNVDGVALILGGETYGLSDEAYQFAINRNGSRVYIPMSNAVESLNNAMSLGIISYEFRRQLNCLLNEESQEEVNDSAVEKSQQ